MKPSKEKQVEEYKRLHRTETTTIAAAASWWIAQIADQATKANEEEKARLIAQIRRAADKLGDRVAENRTMAINDIRAEIRKELEKR